MQNDFYDALAPFNHLLFADWKRFQRWQLDKLAPFLPRPAPEVRVIDCASGIGTQLLPFAAAGYQMTGIDSSLQSVERSRNELESVGMVATILHGDILTHGPDEWGLKGSAHVALLLDNYLTHAENDTEALDALCFARQCLTTQGHALVALRDYDETTDVRPATTVPAFYADGGRRRIVHQVWDWHDDGSYDFHLHFVIETGQAAWETKHFVGRYRPIARSRVVELAREAGFRQIELIPPAASTYHQWLVDART